MPDQANMDELSALATDVEAALGHRAVGGVRRQLRQPRLGARRPDAGRVNELRLGEAILLGVDPLTGSPVPGLRTDAFTWSPR